MNIGIIGTGNMGTALGTRWAQNGHQVLFGSRDSSKAKAVAAQAGNGAQFGDADAAAEFGEVILYTVRGVYPSKLLHDPRALAGKVVIDVNNTDLDAEGRAIGVDPYGPTLVEQLQAELVRIHHNVRAVAAWPHNSDAEIASIRACLRRASAVTRGIQDHVLELGGDSEADALRASSLRSRGKEAVGCG